jgi:hypothetical protein
MNYAEAVLRDVLIGEASFAKLSGTTCRLFTTIVPGSNLQRYFSQTLSTAIRTVLADTGRKKAAARGLIPNGLTNSNLQQAVSQCLRLLQFSLSL